MPRDLLPRMHPCAKSAGTAVDASLFVRVLGAAKNNSPDSLFKPLGTVTRSDGQS